MIKVRPYKIDEFLAKYPFGTVVTVKHKSTEFTCEYTGMVIGYSYCNYNKDGDAYKFMKTFGMSEEVDKYTDADCYKVNLGVVPLSLNELFKNYFIIEDGQEKTIGVECETN